MGGINWAGLEIVATKLGIEDVDDLMDRLMIIKHHTPPKAGDPLPAVPPTLGAQEP